MSWEAAQWAACLAYPDGSVPLKAVFTVIAGHANHETRKCYFGMERIANEGWLSERTHEVDPSYPERENSILRKIIAGVLLGSFFYLVVSCYYAFEEVFGWIKSAAGLAKVKVRGRDRVEAAFILALAAYNLIRLPKLLGTPA